MLPGENRSPQECQGTTPLAETGTDLATEAVETLICLGYPKEEARRIAARRPEPLTSPLARKLEGLRDAISEAIDEFTAETGFGVATITLLHHVPHQHYEQFRWRVGDLGIESFDVQIRLYSPTLELYPERPADGMFVTGESLAGLTTPIPSTETQHRKEAPR